MAASALPVPAQALVNDIIRVERAAAALPQTAQETLFTVTGHVVVRQIIGIITVAIGAVANATKLLVNPDGVGADTDICAALDINAALVDGMFTITGTFANAMVLTANLPLAGKQATEIVCPPGVIKVACAGSDGGTGRVKWECVYWPLEDGASVVAA
jgi:hypothetical protein